MAEIIEYIEEDWASGPVRYPRIQCGCGAEVHCSNSWANEWDCGAEYNRFGQQLADRSQWEYDY